MFTFRCASPLSISKELAYVKDLIAKHCCCCCGLGDLPDALLSESVLNDFGCYRAQCSDQKMSAKRKFQETFSYQVQICF